MLLLPPLPASPEPPLSSAKLAAAAVKRPVKGCVR